ncbi:hypothetical protein AVEN_148318-1, partial [Araneus ventricosus]
MKRRRSPGLKGLTSSPSQCHLQYVYLTPACLEDEIPLGKIKKAVQNAEEAMKMTKQERLMRFSFSVRNGKKRSHTESK